MREILKPYSELLYDDKWIQLRSIKCPEKNISSYTYSHEIRCNGNIIAMLPYRIIDGNVQYLLRKEATPCWELNSPILCSITGGVENNETPAECSIKELLEETGYTITSHELIPLSTCFGTKSTDSVYYLFSVNLTFHDHNDLKKLHIETELEKSSSSSWVDEEFIASTNMVDPMVGILFCRLEQYINKKHNRNTKSKLGNSEIVIITSNFPNIETTYNITNKYAKIYKIDLRILNNKIKININSDYTSNKSISTLCEELLDNGISIEEIYLKNV